MSNWAGIYQIQSIIKPERIYIGSGIDVRKRWATHQFRLRKGNHHSKKLQRHYNKYGPDDLVYSFILGCEKEDLIKNEQFFIDTLNPYFNGSKVAGSTLGMKIKLPPFSAEHRKNISLSKLGKKRSIETRAKMSNSRKGNKNPSFGKPCPPQVISAVLKASVGRRATNEARLKMSKSRKGVSFTPEHRKNISLCNGGGKAKLVLNTETGIYYDSAKEAFGSQGNGEGYSCFCQKIKGQRKHYVSVLKYV
jgi:group I intron endonuclease